MKSMIYRFDSLLFAFKLLIITQCKTKQRYLMQFQQKSCQFRNHKSVEIALYPSKKLQPILLQSPNSQILRIRPPKSFRGYEKNKIKRVARSFEQQLIDNSNTHIKSQNHTKLLVQSAKDNHDIQFWATANVLIFKKNDIKNSPAKQKIMNHNQFIAYYNKNNQNTEALVKNAMLQRNIRTSNNKPNFSSSPDKQVQSPTLRRRVLKTNPNIKSPVIQPESMRVNAQEDLPEWQNYAKFEPSPWDSSNQLEDFDIHIN